MQAKSAVFDYHLYDQHSAPNVLSNFQRIILINLLKKLNFLCKGNSKVHRLLSTISYAS